MAGKRDKPEEIVLKLRQFEVLQGQGKSISDAVRQIGVTQQTYYRWRKEYGGMSRDQLKRLKEAETEKSHERQAVKRTQNRAPKVPASYRRDPVGAIFLNSIQ